jgi:hypothetical protein
MDSATDVCYLTSRYRATIGSLYGLLQVLRKDAGERRVWTFS